jgi:hypothetical protein
MAARATAHSQISTIIRTSRDRLQMNYILLRMNEINGSTADQSGRLISE